MKRIILIAACVLAVGTVCAQENNQKYEFGVNVGMTTYTNYSAVSLFQDQTDVYSNWGAAVHFGLLKGKSMFGLQYRANVLQTSAVNVDEQMFQWGLALMFRHYEPLKDNFELFAGIKPGISLMGNSFDNGDGTDSYQRWTCFVECEMGVNYKLSEKTYIGVSGAVTMGNRLQNKSLNLPAGMTATKKYGVGGYSLMMHYGIRF
jgi:hypothetical protein